VSGTQNTGRVNLVVTSWSVFQRLQIQTSASYRVKWWSSSCLLHSPTQHRNSVLKTALLTHFNGAQPVQSEHFV